MVIVLDFPGIADRYAGGSDRQDGSLGIEYHRNVTPYSDSRVATKHLDVVDAGFRRVGNTLRRYFLGTVGVMLFQRCWGV